jgi:hypothetical protein
MEDKRVINEVPPTEIDAEDLPGPRPGERFVNNFNTAFSFIAGGKVHRFKNGEFITDDSQVIEELCQDPLFGRHIIPDNKKLLPAHLRPKKGPRSGSKRGPKKSG